MTDYVFDERAEQALRTLDWLQDDRSMSARTGRTTLLAASAILRSLRCPMTWVRFPQIDPVRGAPNQLSNLARALVQRVYGSDAEQFVIVETEMQWTGRSPSAIGLMELKLREVLGYKRHVREVVQCWSARQRVVTWLLEERPAVHQSIVDPTNTINQESSWFVATLQQLDSTERALLATTVSRYLTSVLTAGGAAHMMRLLAELDVRLAGWYAAQIPAALDEAEHVQAALRALRNLEDGFVQLLAWTTRKT